MNYTRRKSSHSQLSYDHLDQENPITLKIDYRQQILVHFSALLISLFISIGLFSFAFVAGHLACAVPNCRWVDKQAFCLQNPWESLGRRQRNRKVNKKLWNADNCEKWLILSWSYFPDRDWKLTMRGFPWRIIYCCNRTSLYEKIDLSERCDFPFVRFLDLSWTLISICDTSF